MTVKRVPELVPEDAARQSHFKLDQPAPVATPGELGDYDAIIVGTPTRFGNMAAQMRNFWDQTGGLWMKGALVGKVGSVFASSATQHGGNEPDAGGAKAGSGTTMVSTTGTSADIYPMLFFGKEAYGTVPLRGQGAVEPTVLRPGVKDKADPLGQRGYVGWKTWFTAVILNQVWMARLECGVTAL